MEKVYKGKCSVCGKEFKSLYETQLAFNLAQHEFACKRRREKKAGVVK